MTGAIFARGSCTALKWMALLGAVLVLGAGSASAQVTQTVGATVTEGNSLSVGISLRATRPAATATVTVTVTITGRAADYDKRRTLGEVAGTDSGPDAFFNDDNASGSGLVTTVAFQVTPGTGVYRASKNITLQTSEDVDAEDEGVTLTMTATDGGVTNQNGNTLSLSGAVKHVTIKDDETQKYILKLDSGQTPKEGGQPFTVTATADPYHRQLNRIVRVHLGDPAYSMDSADQEFTIGDQDLTDTTDGTRADSSRTFSIHPPAADKNRDTDELVIKLLEQLSSKELSELIVKVEDKNPLPMVTVMIVDDMDKVFNPQPDKVQEGKSVRLVVMAVDKDGDEMEAGEELTVSLMPADDSTADMRDYSVAPYPIVIDKGKASSMATLTAEEDGVLEAETLILDATVTGEAANGKATREVMGVLELMIEDDTTKLVRAKSEAEIEKVLADAKKAGMVGDKFMPGQKIEIRASSLFNVEEDVTVTYTAMSDKRDVASTSVSDDGVVMVMAQQMEGMAYVTVTAHAKMNMASGVKILDQTDPTEASIRFPVEVMLEELSLKLMGTRGRRDEHRRGQGRRHGQGDGQPGGHRQGGSEAHA